MNSDLPPQVSSSGDDVVFANGNVIVRRNSVQIGNTVIPAGQIAQLQWADLSRPAMPAKQPIGMGLIMQWFGLILAALLVSVIGYSVKAALVGFTMGIVIALLGWLVWRGQRADWLKAGHVIPGTERLVIHLTSSAGQKFEFDIPSREAADEVITVLRSCMR